MTREEHYCAGKAEGEHYGSLDSDNGLGLETWMLSVCQEHVRVSLSPDSRAYYLGRLRGYRESVRTLRGGRWGT